MAVSVVIAPRRWLASTSSRFRRIRPRGARNASPYVYQAAMRSTRDLLRRRLHLVRKRGQLLAHILNTNSQCNNYKVNRAGVADRFQDPCVRKSIEVDLTLIGHYDELIRDLDLHIVRTVKSEDAETFFRLRVDWASALPPCYAPRDSST